MDAFTVSTMGEQYQEAVAIGRDKKLSAPVGSHDDHCPQDVVLDQAQERICTFWGARLAHAAVRPGVGDWWYPATGSLGAIGKRSLSCGQIDKATHKGASQGRGTRRKGQRWGRLRHQFWEVGCSTAGMTTTMVTMCRNIINPLYTAPHAWPSFGTLSCCAKPTVCPSPRLRVFGKWFFERVELLWRNGYIWGDGSL